MPAQAELRPIAQDQPNASWLNRIVSLVRGESPGWLSLVGFNGTKVSSAVPPVTTTGNPALYIQAAAGVTAIQVQKSAGPTNVLLVDDTGATIVALTLNGNLLFSPDNTYDIGAAGATRARDFHLARNALIAGTLGVTGVTTLTGNLIANGATIFANGGQIAFPPTQVPSADVNTLDDYEEGTWTPGLATPGTTTYTTQTGSYVKVGKLVFIIGRLIVNVKDAGASVNTITGLPFTVGTPISAVTVGYWAGSVTNFYYVVGSFTPATTTLILGATTVAVAAIPAATLFQNGAEVQFSGFYFV